MPRHSDEKRPVMPVVCGPPGLGIGHQREDILLHCSQIERFERLSIVVGGTEGGGLRTIAVKDRNIELIGPPHAVRHLEKDSVFFIGTTTHRAFGLSGHVGSDRTKGRREVALFLRGQADFESSE